MIDPVLSFDRITITCFSTHFSSGMAVLYGWLKDPNRGFKAKYFNGQSEWAKESWWFPEDGLYVGAFPRYCSAPYRLSFNLNTVNLEILRVVASMCLYPEVTSSEVAMDFPNERATDWTCLVSGIVAPVYSYRNGEGVPVHSSAYGTRRSTRFSKYYDKKFREECARRDGYITRDAVGEIHELADYLDCMRLESTMRGRKKILFPKAFDGITLIRRDTEINHSGNATTKARLRTIINDPSYLRKLGSSQRSRYRRLLSDPSVVTIMQPTPREVYLRHLPLLREQLLRHIEPFGGYVNPHWLPLNERRAS